MHEGNPASHYTFEEGIMSRTIKCNAKPKEGEVKDIGEGVLCVGKIIVVMWRCEVNEMVRASVREGIFYT